jgi:hypothetical protein
MKPLRLRSLLFSVPQLESSRDRRDVRSRLVDAPDGYAEMAQEMEDLAKPMPGSIDVTAYRADDGPRLTLVGWENEETLKGWSDAKRATRTDPRAQTPP